MSVKLIEDHPYISMGVAFLAGGLITWALFVPPMGARAATPAAP